MSTLINVNLLSICDNNIDLDKLMLFPIYLGWCFSFKIILGKKRVSQKRAKNNRAIEHFNHFENRYEPAT